MAFQQNGKAPNYKAQLERYLEAWDCVNAPPRVRLRAAQKAAGHLITLGSWNAPGDLLRKVVWLLSDINSRFPSPIGQQYVTY